MKFEFSAGGIVFKKEKNGIVILMAQHSGHHGWVFPKGLIGDNPSAGSGQAKKKETKVEAAIREVKEETGVDAEIIRELPSFNFWYQWQGEKKKKTVYYFIMKYLSGDITEHDLEMENVEWVPIEQVNDKLTYSGDKNLWKKAKQLILEDKFEN